MADILGNINICVPVVFKMCQNDISFQLGVKSLKNQNEQQKHVHANLLQESDVLICSV